jgi:hypothetical protein
VLTWLLLGLLGMIWAAFLLPSRKRSPASSVEEFERRMSLLAEANSSVPGRWVLMPRKGARLVGSRDRMRVRARRRRRQVFMALLEMTVLTLLMGLFPPFRVMLYATGALALVLLAYAALLVKIRERELARARVRAAVERQPGYRTAPARARVPVLASARYEAARRVGNGNGRVHAIGNGNGHASANGNGRTNGNGHGIGNGNGAFADILREGGVEIIDDDVHVIVRPRGPVAPGVG